MAPDESIVAYRVGDDAGIWTADVVAALQHILDERPDIDVVNLSLGSVNVQYADAASCDAATPYTAIVSQLRARGTLVVAASGNEARSAAISSPACNTGVVSVGAVYDAAGGGFAFAPCTDTSRAVDQVTCYSNSADFLDLLAPSHCADTALSAGFVGDVWSCFGGTSAASPYAAGAAALLMSSGLTADQAFAELIDSGTPILDPRNSITTPRIDLAEAFNVPSTVTVDGVGGTPATYATVQAALNAVPTGGTVEVPAGTYTASPYRLARQSRSLARGPTRSTRSSTAWSWVNSRGSHRRQGRR